MLPPIFFHFLRCQTTMQMNYSQADVTKMLEAEKKKSDKVLADTLELLNDEKKNSAALSAQLEGAQCWSPPLSTCFPDLFQSGPSQPSVTSSCGVLSVWFSCSSEVIQSLVWSTSSEAALNRSGKDFILFYFSSKCNILSLSLSLRSICAFFFLLFINQSECFSSITRVDISFYVHAKAAVSDFFPPSPAHLVTNGLAHLTCCSHISCPHGLSNSQPALCQLSSSASSPL